MAAEAAGGAGASGEAAGASGAARAGAPKGVLLAIAIIVLWLAGFCFFIALEGSQLLAEQADTTGGGLLKAILGGLAQRALSQEQAGG